MLGREFGRLGEAMEGKAGGWGELMLGREFGRLGEVLEGKAGGWVK